MLSKYTKPVTIPSANMAMNAANEILQCFLIALETDIDVFIKFLPLQILGEDTSQIVFEKCSSRVGYRLAAVSMPNISKSCSLHGHYGRPREFRRSDTDSTPQVVKKIWQAAGITLPELRRPTQYPPKDYTDSATKFFAFAGVFQFVFLWWGHRCFSTFLF